LLGALPLLRNSGSEITERLVKNKCERLRGKISNQENAHINYQTDTLTPSRQQLRSLMKQYRSKMQQQVVGTDKYTLLHAAAANLIQTAWRAKLTFWHLRIELASASVKRMEPAGVLMTRETKSAQSSKTEKKATQIEEDLDEEEQEEERAMLAMATVQRSIALLPPHALKALFGCLVPRLLQTPAEDQRMKQLLKPLATRFGYTPAPEHHLNSPSRHTHLQWKPPLTPPPRRHRSESSPQPYSQRVYSQSKSHGASSAHGGTAAVQPRQVNIDAGASVVTLSATTPAAAPTAVQDAGQGGLSSAQQQAAAGQAVVDRAVVYRFKKEAEQRETSAKARSWLNKTTSQSAAGVADEAMQRGKEAGARARREAAEVAAAKAKKCLEVAAAEEQARNAAAAEQARKARAAAAEEQARKAAAAAAAAAEEQARNTSAAAAAAEEQATNVAAAAAAAAQEQARNAAAAEQAKNTAAAEEQARNSSAAAAEEEQARNAAAAAAAEEEQARNAAAAEQARNAAAAAAAAEEQARHAAAAAAAAPAEEKA
jgi:hypothetical protein